MGSFATVQSSQSLSSSRLRPPEWVLIMGALLTFLSLFALWHAFGTPTSCAADAVFRCVYVPLLLSVRLKWDLPFCIIVGISCPVQVEHQYIHTATNQSA